MKRVEEMEEGKKRSKVARKKVINKGETSLRRKLRPPLEAVALFESSHYILGLWTVTMRTDWINHGERSSA